MSRINQLFKQKPSSVLNVYFTAGYPYLHATMDVLKALEEHGADMIEIGIPFSDPLADGPVIQQSNAVALVNGMTITLLFEQLRNMRDSDLATGIGTNIPVILMGYMNPILQYGFEKFCADAAAVGVDGLILPDLPAHEFETTYGPVIHQYGLDFIFLVTPETTDPRVRHLDGLSSGFLYAVSSSAITGKRNMAAVPGEYLQRLRKLALKNPILVGFGISDKTSFDAVSRYARGAITGSAFIMALGNSRNVNAATKSFLSSMRG